VGGTTTYGAEESQTPTYASGGTYATGGSYGATETDDSGSGRTDAAKQEASRLKDTTAGAAGQVASTAKEQAGQVASTAKEQAGNLMQQARSQLTEQVTSQRDRATGGLRGLADELQTIAECSGQSGPATQMVQQGSQTARQLAEYFEQRQPSDLVEDLRSFARQRPGAFLFGATLAGVAVGRLTRGAVSARSSDSDDQSYSGGYGGGYDSSYGSGYGTYQAGYTAGLAEPVAAPPSGAMPSPAAAPVPPPPVLEEPYGSDQPAGYDQGRGDRL
jgi:uncharacterized protein YjbJ (UPF0337 family)